MATPNNPTLARMKMKTTGDLREFLMEVMTGLRNGSMEEDRARVITKVAQQVTESLYSELKNKKLAMEAGEQVFALGTLHVGAEEK